MAPAPTWLEDYLQCPHSTNDPWLARDWPVLRTYTGRQLDRLAMPLGGIGTGTISLGGRSDLRDWEIVNRPAKGFSPRHALFSIRGAGEDCAPFATCLEGPLTSGFEGWSGSPLPHAGLPRFSETVFHAAYPLAQIVLTDSRLPVDVRIEAWNPLIPPDPDASGLAVAVFRFVVHNTGASALDISVASVVENFIGRDGAIGESIGNVNELTESEALPGVTMR